MIHGQNETNFVPFKVVGFFLKVRINFKREREREEKNIVVNSMLLISIPIIWAISITA